MPGPFTLPSTEALIAKDQVTVSLTRPADTPASFSAARTPSRAESIAFVRHHAPEGTHFGALSKKSGSLSKINMATAGCHSEPRWKPNLKPWSVAAFHVSKQSYSGHSAGSFAFSVW